MFKTETLIAFIQVAAHRSFTSAANLQGQTPMAMSKQVSKLESLLAEPLFERSTRKVTLTQFGEEFLQQAKQILAQHETLNNWLESRRGKFTGVLKVVAQAPDIYKKTVFPWLGEFHQAYPDIELEFDLYDKVIDITHQKYDIYWGVTAYLGNKHPGLKARSLWRSQYGIYASKEYLTKFGTPETPEDLKHHHVIGYLHNQPDNILVVNKTPSLKNDKPDHVLLEAPIKTVSGQLDLALQGLGLINAAHDNWDIEEYVASKRLIPVLADYWWPSAEIYLYYHDVKTEQPKVRAFIDFFISKRDLW